VRKLSAWGPPAVWLALMLAATSIPHLDTSAYPNADKVFHLAVYAVLAVLTVRAMHLSGRPVAGGWLLLALAGGAAVGALDEVHEFLIPGRTVSLLDFMFNLAGYGLGLYLGSLRFKLKREAPAA